MRKRRKAVRSSSESWEVSSGSRLSKCIVAVLSYIQYHNVEVLSRGQDKGKMIILPKKPVDIGEQDGLFVRPAVEIA